MHKLIWTGPRAVMETGATYFSEVAGDAQTVGLQRADGGVDDGDDHVDWTLDVYFEEKPDITRLQAALSAFDPTWATIADPHVEDLPDIDWVAHALEGLGIVEAGRFVLYGVHDEDKLPNDDALIPIRVDANQAFGTGHHPTTEGCLRLLDRFAGMPPHSIFDLGCGSAVLSIAAAKLWDRPILASDIDAPSVAIARENAAINGVGDKVDVIEADGFDHDAIRTRAPFDFIFANILAGPLMEFAPAMAELVSHHGRVMLAGLMAEQEEKVRTAYETAGFRQINRLDHQTWPVLLLVKA